MSVIHLYSISENGAHTTCRRTNAFHVTHTFLLYLGERRPHNLPQNKRLPCQSCLFTLSWRTAPTQPAAEQTPSISVIHLYSISENGAHTTCRRINAFHVIHTSLLYLGEQRPHNLPQNKRLPCHSYISTLSRRTAPTQPASEQTPSMSLMPLYSISENGAHTTRRRLNAFHVIHTSLLYLGERRPHNLPQNKRLPCHCISENGAHTTCRRTNAFHITDTSLLYLVERRPHNLPQNKRLPCHSCISTLSMRTQPAEEQTPFMSFIRLNTILENSVQTTCRGTNVLCVTHTSLHPHICSLRVIATWLDVLLRSILDVGKNMSAWGELESSLNSP